MKKGQKPTNVYQKRKVILDKMEKKGAAAGLGGKSGAQKTKPAPNAEVGERPSSKSVYDYKADAILLSDFFKEFFYYEQVQKVKKSTNFDDYMEEDDEEDERQDAKKIYKYQENLDKIAKRETNKFCISFEDLHRFSEKTNDLCKKMEKNTARYIEIAYQIVDELLSKNKYQMTPSQFFSDNAKTKDVLDVLLYHRKQRLQQIEKEKSQANTNNNNNNDNNNNNQNNNKDADTTSLPLTLQRRYEILVEERKNMEILDLRNVKAKHIGKLVKLRGIVTRISDVKPLLLIATYTCQDCGFENYQEVKSRSFMPLLKCGSSICTNKRTGSGLGSLQFQTRGSKFLKFQEIKIQELVLLSFLLLLLLLFLLFLIIFILNHYFMIIFLFLNFKFLFKSY